MEQASLLSLLGSGAVGLAGVMPAVRAGMNRAAKNYAPGRKMLVDAINDVAEREGIALTSGGGKSVKPDIVDKWLQPRERGHAPSFEAILCFCLATGDHTPLEPLWRSLGLAVIPAKELPYLEIGKAEVEKKKADSKRKAAWAKL
jgi:hypothetical protein